MKNFFSFMLMCMIFGSVEAQKLDFVHSRKILLNGKKLSREQVIEQLKKYPFIQSEYRSGKTLRTVGDVTFFSGLFFTGLFLYKGFNPSMEDNSSTIYYGNGFGNPYQTINLKSPKPAPKWAVFLGGGLMLITIPLKIAGKSHIKHAIKKHNEFQETSFENFKSDYDFSLVVNENGAGLKLIF